MKIIIIENTVCDKKVVRKGTTVQTTPEEAQILISLGKAKVFEEFKEENRTEDLQDRAIKKRTTKKRGLKK